LQPDHAVVLAVHPMAVALLAAFLFANLILNLIFDLYELLFFFDSRHCLHLHFPSADSLDLKLVETGLNDLSVYKDFPLAEEDFESDYGYFRPFLDSLVEILNFDLLVAEVDSFQESLVQSLLNAVPYQGFPDY